MRPFDFMLDIHTCKARLVQHSVRSKICQNVRTRLFPFGPRTSPFGLIILTVGEKHKTMLRDAAAWAGTSAVLLF